MNSTSTDAVNGSQLFAAQDAIETLSDRTVKYDVNPDGTPNYNNVSLNPGGSPTTVTNVAPGAINAGSTDAVNGSQLFTTNTNVTNLGNTVTTLGNTVTTLGTTVSNLDNRVTNINDKGTKYFHANSTGADSRAVGADSVAIGQNAEANGAGNVALGLNSVATGATLGNAAYTPTAGANIAGTAPVGEVSVGGVGTERRIVNVAAGSGSTDAVNVSQLQAVTANATANAVQYNDATRTTVTLNPGGTATTVTNVAPGAINAGSTDAVNGSQLFTTNNNVTTVDGRVTTLGTTVTNLDNRVTIINDKGTKYFHANSTGADSRAVGADSVAIGQNAEANGAGNVALGLNSLATGSTLGTAAYTPTAGAKIAGTAPVGEVSVGGVNAERRITNVAAGAGGTDAVNVSQLQAVTANATANAVQYDNSTRTTVTLNPGGTSTTITNVAPGAINAGSTDAVNGSQLFTTNNNVTTVDGRVTTLGTTVTNLDNRVTIINDKGTKYFHANSTGADSRAVGADSVAIGQNAEANGAGNVALGANSVATGTTLANPAYLVGGTATGEVNVGNRRVTGVSAGAGDTDAVNVLQLKQVAAGASANSVLYDGADKTRVTLNPSGNGALTTVTNVAAGNVTDTSSDAVNGSQLFATNTNVTNLGTTVTNLDNRVTNINDKGTKYFHANSTGVDSRAVGTDSVAIGQNAEANGAGNVALGADSKATGTTLTNQAYLVGGAATGEVNVGNRRVTGVSAGAEDTDAVNVTQLRRLHDESVRYDVLPNGAINYSSITVGNESGSAVIHNVANGVAATDAVNVSQLTTVAASAGKWITGNPTVYVAPSATGAGSTAVGSGAVSGGTNSVALGNNSSDAGRANVVSVGTVGAERQITNVGAGVQNTDAVNVSQLRPLAEAFGGGTQVNTDGSITGPTYNISTVNAGGTTTTQTYNNVGDALGGLSNSVVNLSDTVSNISTGGGIKYFRANSTAADAVAGGAESTAMGPQSTAAGDGAVAAGDRSQASGSGSVAVGQQSVASGASSVAVGQGAQATNTGSVAIGLNSTSSGVNTVAIGTGAVATNSVAVGAGAQAGGGGAAFGDNAIALNTSKGTALGNGATVNTTAGVALGSDSLADRAGMNGQREAVSNVAVSSTQGAVSVGSAGNERQITNVAGGTQATDAVNVRQLQASQAGAVRYDTNADGSTNYNNVTLGNNQAPAGTTVSNVAPGVAGTDAVNVNQLNAGVASANQYTDSKFGQVQANIDKLSKDSSAGTAGAMAMANLPQATLPGKGMVSAGVGSFDGQAAIAVGVSKMSDNGRWVVRFSGTANSRGQVGVAGGVGFHW